MSRVLFDFTDAKAVEAWRAIDDRVMGGESRSTLRADAAGHAVFEGRVSRERNGGFASVRSSAGERGWPGARACRIELSGEPRPYKLALLTDDGFDSPSYQTRFTPMGTGWQTLTLPLADFRASFRGRELSGAPPLDSARIRQVGLLTSDGPVGPFELHLRRIELD